MINDICGKTLQLRMEKRQGNAAAGLRRESLVFLAAASRQHFHAASERRQGRLVAWLRIRESYSFQDAR